MLWWCSLMMVNWHLLQFGDIATWVQSLATVGAFVYAKRVFEQDREAYRQDRLDRRAEDRRQERSLCDELLSAAVGVTNGLNTHRAASSKLSFGSHAWDLAMDIAGSRMSRLLTAATSVASLGHADLTDATWNYVNAVIELGRNVDSKAPEWTAAEQTCATAMGRYQEALTDHFAS